MCYYLSFHDIGNCRLILTKKIIGKVTIKAYLEATKLAVAAKSTEIARRYTESEQKVMEYATEVSRANRELARLEQAKTDFISIAAHELKTPLTLVQGYVNILRDMEVNKLDLQADEEIIRVIAKRQPMARDLR